MTSWLRVLGLRVAMLGALVATVLATHMAVPKPDLPFVLLESFDQAFALAYGAAEREVVALEATPPASSVPRDVAALLDAFERQVAAACDAASVALETELVLADALAPERRAAVLGCIHHHLAAVRSALARASDPEERAEYAVTYDRLRAIRDRV
ncbi:MAG TPA: hypothetical protein VFT22_09630 [Kofleriaceae bacterium]|nr:hypothetical protein [Kofleriaceae bacterium]